MENTQWTTFEHPRKAFRLEYPEPWEFLIQKEGANCGFGPRDREDVGLWISIMPIQLDTDQLTDELPKMFKQAMGQTNATNLRGDNSLRYHAMKADVTGDGQGGNYWLVAGGDLVLLASSQVPASEREIWNPVYNRVMASLTIHRDDELLRVQVANEVMRVLKEKTPDEQFELVDDGIRCSRFHVYLANIYRDVHGSPERLRPIVENFVAGILDSAPAEVGEAPGSEVWEEVQGDILPVIKPLAYIHDEGPTQHLTYLDWLGEVIVCYAINRKTSFRYLTNWDLDRWKLDQETLHDQAITNLRKLPWPDGVDSANQPGVGRTMLIHTGDNLDASRLLHPDLHQLLKQPLGSPFLAAIPDRDTLVAFTESDELRAHIERQVRKDHDKSAYPISHRLFLVTADGVALA